MQWIKAALVSLLAGLWCCEATHARLSKTQMNTLVQESPSVTIRSLASGRDQLIVCYGTSLTYGGAWVDQLHRELQQRFPCRVLLVNSGVGGQASPAGLGRLQTRVLRTNPDCVFLEFGINDAYEGYNIPVSACRNNLETMIDRILETNPECEIILMTMNPTVGKADDVRPNLDAYYQVYRDVAAERALMLIDHHVNWNRVLETDRSAFDKFVPDGLHPGALGCSVVITPAILDALGLEAGFEESWNTYRNNMVNIQAALPRDLKTVSGHDVQSLPVLRVARVADDRVTVDGNLTEKVWAGAWSAGFVTGLGEPAEVETAVQAAVDSRHLYLAFVCADANGRQVKASALQESDIFGRADDALVIFLQPEAHKPLYYQLAFNPKGVHFDQKVEDGQRDYAFTPPWVTAVQRAGDRWTAEAALPLHTLLLDGQSLNACRINFHRRVRDDLAAPSSWSFSGKDWHQPARFGRLELDRSSAK